MDEKKWPREAIAMENRANDVRKRSLLAIELMKMGYGGDKKGLGEALQEIDPAAKIPKFKVYGKNNTASELKDIIKDQRLS